MSRVICSPQQMLPRDLERGAVYYSMYTASQRQDVGSVGTGLLDDLELKGIYPSLPAWDFATFALAVGASDLAVQRSNSADGWTRVIELEVALQNPEPFSARKRDIEEMLRFLTGDFWHLTFLEGGRPRALSTAPARFDADCVCLLSGEMDTPAFRLSHDADANMCVVSLPGPYYHPAFASGKNSDGPNYWRQHVELGSFVEGALEGRLRFAPQVGRTVPLDVCVAYTECWRCKKTTGLVIDLCFAASRVLQGAADVTAKIYDFDDEGKGAALLMSTLPVETLARHRIGPIKPRYSRTEGQPYLSNGCIHCDALQGRFFDHEVAYDAQPVFSVDVLFDDGWVSHLEDREAIDKWWFGDRPSEGTAEDAPQS